MTRTTELKSENIQSVRECFYRNDKSWTKNELSQETGLSLAACTNTLKYLLTDKEIVYLGEGESTGGRPSKHYQLNPEAGMICRMIILRKSDHCTYLFSMINLSGELTSHRKVIGKEGSLSECISCMKTFFAISGRPDVICISIPGVSVNGKIQICDVRNLEGADLGKAVSDEFGIAWCIENDTNAACIGLYHLMPEADSLALILQPEVEYFGCGIMINGKLYNGMSHAAGELRYLPDIPEGEENDPDPVNTMIKMIQSVTAVLNPQVIGYHSEFFHNRELSMDQIPDENKPSLIEIADVNTYINNGLNAIGREVLLRLRKESRGK